MAYTDKLRVVYGDYTLGVHGEGFDYIFSYAQGGLESIVKNGYEWLYRCPKPTFWRALTDNDRGSKFHIKSGRRIPYQCGRRHQIFICHLLVAMKIHRMYR